MCAVYNWTSQLHGGEVICATCRPALHIYNWAQTALRGLVTMEQTLNSSLHEYIDAFRQKDHAEVRHLSVLLSVPLSDLPTEQCWCAFNMFGLVS